MEGTPKQQRRHDERWQREMLRGLARLHDVLHDVSDGVEKLARLAEANASPPPPALPVDHKREQILLSVNDLAELLGVSTRTVRKLRDGNGGPAVTKVGGLVKFHRSDVDEWLRAQREIQEDEKRSWRGSCVPGGIGSSMPHSSERRDNCPGSHTEPFAASRYSGRAVCGVCKDDVIVNADGRLRKHIRYRW